MHACCCCLTARWPLAENLVLSATVRSSSTVPRATSGLSAQDSNISDSMLQTRMPASYAHALRLLPSSSIDDRFFSLSPPLSTSFLRSPRTILPGYGANAFEHCFCTPQITIYSLGDGSCLFRSLSDQLHGTPNYHLTIRSEVCNFLLYHQEEFIAFIDDSNHSSPQAAFAAHVAEMRMSATYGTQVEIVAFARMVKRRVKVIQAELVYVIGYEDESPTEREKRRLRSDSKGKAKEDGADLPDLYIVYHNWEVSRSCTPLSRPI